MLSIKNINVSLKNENKKIIKDLSLEINDGETHAIMGPNGTGKSTLAKVIMGHYLFTLTGGEIFFNGTKLNDLTTDERAKLGIFLAMQDPTVIDGVTNSEFLKTSSEEITGKHIDYFKFITEVNNSLKDLEFSKDMIHRHVNAGFSGGEKKKNEVLQIKILKPKLIILDELDSGLDVDSLKIVCENINKYKSENPDTSILIITHYPRILEMIKPDYVHVMKNGTIVKTGDISLATLTEKVGYNE
jgi:feS assembly ATPase sufC